MAESSLEREKSFQQYLGLSHGNKRSKSNGQSSKHNSTQFHDIDDLRSPWRVETIRSEEVKEVCWRKIQIDVFKAEEGSE